jgi:cytidylate kinase
MVAPTEPGRAAGHDVPVITIDGPTASGKGTIAERVADRLGWHYLDSGALYRLVALVALRAGVADSDGAGLARLAAGLQPALAGGRLLLDGEDVTAAIRAEDVGRMASRAAVQPALRAALVGTQRAFRRPPGLVADGRDMGTVIFPDAVLKVYLTADVASRAQRRHKQLIEKGFSANLADLLRDLQERDARDSQRASAPLRAAEGAFELDSTSLDIEQTVRAVLDRYERVTRLS